MERRELGPSGINVHPVGLGGMPMSIQGRPDEAQSIRTICAALDAGVDFIDTADVYCLDDDDLGHNERLIAKAIAEWGGDRARITVATKAGVTRPRGEWGRDGRPEHIRRACERSLKALGVDAIDLYQLHAPDDRVPLQQTIEAFAQLVAQGKVRNIGLSNVSVPQIKLAQTIVPIVSVQNRCNVYDRRPWQDGVLAYCEKQGIAFLPYSPVGGRRDRQRLADDKRLQLVARRHGVSVQRVAIAWLLYQSAVTIPIPGASKPEHATDSARAASLQLRMADLEELARAFPTP